MACFRRYPNVYQRALPYVTSGMWAKPPWFAALRRSPPELKLKYPRPPTVTFPEDKLYETLLQRIPLLELQTDTPATFQRTIGHRFAQTQYKYMTNEKMSEDDAFVQCEKDFAKEIKGLEDNLESLHSDGAQRASFNSIKKNVSQHARVSGTISELLEERINMQMAGKLFPDPLNMKHDSHERRRAKLKRLAEDPAIGFIKSNFRAKKPAVLRALDTLISEPDSVDTKFYNEELRSYLGKLAIALYSHDGANDTAAKRDELQGLKGTLGKLTHKVKTFPFSALDVADRKDIIEVVRGGLRNKLVAAPVEPSIYLSTHQQETRVKVRELQQQLSVEETDRSLQDRLGKDGYSKYREINWWRESDQRKNFKKRLQESRSR